MLRGIVFLVFIFFQGRVFADQSAFSHFEPVSWMKDFVLAHKEVYQTGSIESLKKLMHPGYLEVYLEQKFESLFWRRRESDSISVNNLDYKFTMARILDWEYPKPNVLVMLGRWNYGISLKVLRDGELLINRHSWSDNDVIFAIEKGEHGYQAICTSELYKPLEADPDEAKDVWKNSTLLCMEEDFGKTKSREWRLQILGFPPDQPSQMQESTTSGAINLNVLDEKISPYFIFDRDNAQSYALKHAKNYNSSYPGFNSDCTNFASQILYHGGRPMIGGEGNDTEGFPDMENWYIRKLPNGKFAYNQGWSVASTFARNIQHHNLGSWQQFAGDLGIGDLIFLHKPSANRITHVYFVCGCSMQQIGHMPEQPLPDVCAHSKDREGDPIKSLPIDPPDFFRFFRMSPNKVKGPTCAEILTKPPTPEPPAPPGAVCSPPNPKPPLYADFRVYGNDKTAAHNFLKDASPDGGPRANFNYKAYQMLYGSDPTWRKFLEASKNRGIPTVVINEMGRRGVRVKSRPVPESGNNGTEIAAVTESLEAFHQARVSYTGPQCLLGFIPWLHYHPSHPVCCNP